MFLLLFFELCEQCAINVSVASLTAVAPLFLNILTALFLALSVSLSLCVSEPQCLPASLPRFQSDVGCWCPAAPIAQNVHFLFLCIRCPPHCRSKNCKCLPPRCLSRKYLFPPYLLFCAEIVGPGTYRNFPFFPFAFLCTLFLIFRFVVHILCERGVLGRFKNVQ